VEGRFLEYVNICIEWCPQKSEMRLAHELEPICNV
jgi:hypothetical protein